MPTLCRRRITRLTTVIDGRTGKPWVIRINEGGRTLSAPKQKANNSSSILAHPMTFRQFQEEFSEAIYCYAE